MQRSRVLSRVFAGVLAGGLLAGCGIKGPARPPLVSTPSSAPTPEGAAEPGREATGRGPFAPAPPPDAGTP